MDQQTVVSYMETVLGPVVAAVNITQDALYEAATMVEAAYGVAFANMVDQLKWRSLAEFYALDTALNFAAPFYKFSADNTVVQGSDVFAQLYKKWEIALSKVSGYLADAGIVVSSPGSKAGLKNSPIRVITADLNYLTDYTV